jgi:shikimate dehydrogenase
MAQADGLIHATPTGMTGYPGLPLDPDLLQPRHWVAEIVYFPLKTELLKAARRKGCRVLDGGWMAVFQAVKAFELFTRVTPDADRMLQHFQQLLERRGEGRGPGGDTRESGRASA